MATNAPAITPRLVRNALRIVFGPDSPQATDLSVLAVLSQRELAGRFRARALELHPDRAGAVGQRVEALERAFKQLHGAYRLLGRVLEDDALKQRLVRTMLATPSPQATVRPAYQRSARSGTEAGEPSHQRRPDSADAGTGMYYTGRVPERELRFAQFLYYNGVIDWRTMIDAITWQYRVRPKVGEISRTYRFLDFDAVSRVLRMSPQGELFGSTAMRLGVMDLRQVHVVLGKQHQLNYPIGRYFVEHQILTKPEVDHLLVQHRRHNLRNRRS